MSVSGILYALSIGTQHRKGVPL